MAVLVDNLGGATAGLIATGPFSHGKRGQRYHMRNCYLCRLVSAVPHLSTLIASNLDIDKVDRGNADTTPPRMPILAVFKSCPVFRTAFLSLIVHGGSAVIHANRLFNLDWNFALVLNDLVRLNGARAECMEFGPVPVVEKAVYGPAIHSGLISGGFCSPYVMSMHSAELREFALRDSTGVVCVCIYPEFRVEARPISYWHSDIYFCTRVIARVVCRGTHLIKTLYDDERLQRISRSAESKVIRCAKMFTFGQYMRVSSFCIDEQRDYTGFGSEIDTWVRSVTPEYIDGDVQSQRLSRIHTMYRTIDQIVNMWLW